MAFKYLARLSRQHRTIYCYLILSIWIFLLIAGIYKYIGTTLSIESYKNRRNFMYTSAQGRDEINDQGRRNIHECNNPDEIALEMDGGSLEGWSLTGVLLITRHGDRGPMEHIRGIGTINCGYDNSLPLLHRYKTFITNSTMNAYFGHSVWLKNGPFHGFPLLPPLERFCLLGQLTYRGLAQHLKIGEILRQAYAAPLGLLHRQQTVPNTRVLANISLDSKNIANGNLSPESNIIVYSTRYRRTFQSAMALLYAFLPIDQWMGITVRESHSLSFCFKDCACQQAERIRKEVAKEDMATLHQHPAIAAVVHWIGMSLMQNPIVQINPMEVRDALLALLCHDTPLPCRKAKDRSTKNNPDIVTTPDNRDVINIDQEEGQTSPKDNLIDVEDIETNIEPEGCVEQSHVDALMSFTNWQGAKKVRSPNNRRLGILRAYGLIRNIVGNMLKMISGENIKFVLYSGHDRTLQYLLSALGLQSQQFFIPYAAKMSFEVYKSNYDAQFYFRVVYNGRDVTNKIVFCEGGRSLRVSRGNRGEKADLCPIENIIRFIHDDYFVPLNATNYKDACTINQQNEDFR
ncbi:2-phosphoxylose phosphatase 1 [Lutzomyia longipalpis]|uniref:2-phosphoxylose phosphatase 1 n=1 Tax=Lutzomyia longipalpis TaxID=7200 RepID=UPI002483F361|nr:2-phosphoxylose phosphatase 1 [Lutzomyia longipalpis]